MTEKILRFRAVKERTGFSRSSIYLKMAEGGFPHSISLGSRSIGWLQSDIDAWINERIQLSRKNISLPTGGNIA
jgi:prophage regulatory protein